MKVKRYQNSPEQKQCFKIIIKTICAYIYAIFPLAYLLVGIHYLFRKRKRYQYEVSVCLIFKNEAKYLKEWIEYHKLIGIDHFYLYNNFSNDNYYDVLLPYIQQGIVTLTDWPKQYAQIEAYEHCYHLHKKETHWLGYIDADEFVNLRRHNNIKEFLSKYDAFPSIMLRWKMFGTSGNINEPKHNLVIEQYVASWPYLCAVGKSFINNDYKFYHIDVHSCKTKVAMYPIYAVNDMKIFTPFTNSMTCYIGNPRAYINHYWSKSYENYINKDFIKGDVLSAKNVAIKKISGRFEWHELNNSTRDYSIQRWLVFLKKNML